MRIYSENGDKRLLKMKCNKCGRDIFVENGIVKEGAFNVEYNWNYFSKKDGERHIFDLCEECYDEMVRKFIIEVEIKDNIELL